MRITYDALMITAGKDPVLSPKLAAKMEETVPNLTRGVRNESALVSVRTDSSPLFAAH